MTKGKVHHVGSSRSAATAIEYVFIVALIAVVVLATAAALGTATSGSFDTSGNQIVEAVQTEP